MLLDPITHVSRPFSTPFFSLSEHVYTVTSTSYRNHLLFAFASLTMDPIGLISLLYEVSKDLYNFYQVAKDRDNDVTELRAQMLGLQQKSVLLSKALSRKGLQAEDKTEAEGAILECKNAAEKLREALEELKLAIKTMERGSISKFRRFLQDVFHEVRWPFEKPALDALSRDMRTCHLALDRAIALLHLNVSVTTIEELRRLDQRVVENTITPGDALSKVGSNVENAFKTFLAGLAQHAEELARQANALKEQAEEQAQKALADIGDCQSHVVESSVQTFGFVLQKAQEITNLKFF